MEELKCFNVTDYFTILDGRIFFDISYSGCGSNCSYCYVDTKNDKQHLLSFERIRYICDYIEDNFHPRKYIISLCPNTEPLKSDKSASFILYIARYFLERDNFIQISTKEKIDTSFLDKINSISDGRVYIHISIPFLDNTEKIEPFAAPVNCRLENFILGKKYNSVHFVLYIKPYSQKTNENMLRYVQVINKYDIQNVCVGVRFEAMNQMPCISLYDPLLANRMMSNQKDHIVKFIDYLREFSSAKVYCSSTCIINCDSKNDCSFKLFNYSSSLCADCISD